MNPVGVDGGIHLSLKQQTSPSSLNGVTHELQIGDGLTGIMFQGHNELPEEWSPGLTELISDFNSMANHRPTQAPEQGDAP